MTLKTTFFSDVEYLMRYIIGRHESRCTTLDPPAKYKEISGNLGYKFVSVQPELKVRSVKSVKIEH